MKVHERIRIALLSLFVSFTAMAVIVYLVYGYAESNTILFFSMVFLVSSGVAIFNLLPLAKDWRNAKTELAQWSKDNPKESLIMGYASIAASLLILLFFMWPYIGSGFSQSSPRDIKALLFGLLGVLTFFIIGRILLKTKDKN